MINLGTRADDAKTAIRLVPMTANYARTLAPIFASIEPWSRYPYQPAELITYLTEIDPSAPRYALLVGGKPAGAIGVRWRWLRGPYLQFLAVSPNYQSAGHGKRLLAWLEGTARASGEGNLWVATSEFNTRARAFYERHGFTVTGTLDGLIKPGVNELLLRKQIDRQS